MDRLIAKMCTNKHTQSKYVTIPKSHELYNEDYIEIIEVKK